MKRNPRKVKWTKAYRRLHGKVMTQDSTFEFERERNRPPERYDRNFTEIVLKAMKKIDKVRFERADKYIKNRWRKKGEKEQEATKELEQSIHMAKAPSVLQQESTLTLPKIQVKVSQQQTTENNAMEE